MGNEHCSLFLVDIKYQSVSSNSCSESSFSSLKFLHIQLRSACSNKIQQHRGTMFDRKEEGNVKSTSDEADLGVCQKSSDFFVSYQGRKVTDVTYFLVYIHRE